MKEDDLKQVLKAERFVDRWSNREGGQERANYSLFLTELCDVIGVPHPDPAGASHDLNDYVFERRVERRLADGALETGRIDLYKRGHFILEAKQSRLKGGRKAIPDVQGDLFSEDRQSSNPKVGVLDHFMINARRQAENYAHALPKDHPYPPFILVCDVGRAIELYADFSGHGRHYHQFPDASGFRINLKQLKDPNIRDLLHNVWQQPRKLDPALKTAKITREIAGKLAEISRALEARGFEARTVALFLMRCLFTMFVEDVELIKKDSFKELLDRCVENPNRFPFELADLWRHMDIGDYSPAVGEKLLRFNGKLFKHANAIPFEIALLRDAAAADWRDLEPAIFGTLFEQALDPEDRKKLGAHYTPRTYVERVVDATIIEPLTADWVVTQSAAERALRSGSQSTAVRETVDFLKRLSSVRVLDPACGTGNFLYVALRRMKQLEGEVLKQLHDLGGRRAVADVHEISVKPEQFLGMEINERAIEIAELVLWIGYLQWHLRTRNSPPQEPVLGDSDHVRAQNALLTWTGSPQPQLKRDTLGKPMVDRGGYPIYSYPNASKPEWPEADFIVGNPPFVGGKDIRSRLGEGYATALRSAYGHISPSADYVMYWWDRAAELLSRNGTRLRCFGFVTTNSITQVLQRRVIERYLTGESSLSLSFAIPDHPWTKASKDAAAVRIAITVAVPGSHEGRLRKVVREEKLDTDEPIIEFRETKGLINTDLTIGTDITNSSALLANDGLCSPGVKLHGNGFLVTREEAERLGLGRRNGLRNHIRDYRNGRDITSRARGLQVIDLFGLSAEHVRRHYPEIYEHLLETVKPQRLEVHRKSGTRDAQEYLNRWWILGKPRQELRPALNDLERYIVTVETMKHRVFQFLDSSILPDNMLIAIASDSAHHLGVLSSRIHVAWALRAGGRLGVGNDPRYSKSRCFDPFPFPVCPVTLEQDIGHLAQELDSVRKKVLEEHSDLTLTTLYNVLEQIKAGVVLEDKALDVKERGRVLILKDLHERIDESVSRAYGWPSTVNDDEIVERLVALNAQRAADEQRGFIRWLRPDYQIEKLGPLAHRGDRVQSISIAHSMETRIFPNERKAQAGEVLDLLTRSRSPLTAEQISLQFKDGKRVTSEIQDVLRSLNRLGEADSLDNGRSYFRSAS